MATERPAVILLTKRMQIKRIVKRHLSTHPFKFEKLKNGLTAGEEREKLRALDLDTAEPSDVNACISDPWIHVQPYECYMCGNATWHIAAVELGSGEDGMPTYCFPCLANATSLLELAIEAERLVASKEKRSLVAPKEKRSIE